VSDPASAETRVVFGVHPVEELVRARPRTIGVLYVAEGTRSPDIDRVVQLARDRAVSVELRPRHFVAEVAKAPAHQGLVALVGAYRYSSLGEMISAAGAARERLLLLLLDGITDPHNFGALVRSAEVLGAHGVVVSSRHAASVTGTVVKASAGATERMRIAEVANLLKTIDALRERGMRVWGAAASTGDTPAVDIVDFREDVAIVIGSEGAGMREAVSRRCDGLFHIPQRGVVASLNASVAGAIVLYEASRQRRAALPPTRAHPPHAQRRDPRQVPEVAVDVEDLDVVAYGARRDQTVDRRSNGDAQPSSGAVERHGLLDESAAHRGF
jgi:23S rRNA (guanosine2251-2'-O)-methyltransferase